MRVAIVVSRYNQFITQGLLEGALGALRKRGFKPGPKDVIWVPGAFELPLAAKILAQSRRVDAVIALGCVLKGETLHNHYISEAAAHGLMRVSLETGIPVAFGVLTPNSIKQAKERSGIGAANKGTETARAAIEMARLLKTLKA